MEDTLNLPVYEVVVEGKRFRVEVSQKSKDEFELKIDDEEVLEAKVKGELDGEKPFELEIGEKTYTITLDRITRRKPFQVKVNDFPFTVEFKRPTFEVKLPTAKTIVYPDRKPPSTTLAVPEGAVIAPMTGKIVSVKVKEGDAVKRGTVVCVLEAMKMENEITAPKDGVVKEVNVSEGSAVNEGEVLLVIK